MSHKIKRVFGFFLTGLVVASLLAIPNPLLAGVKVRIYVPAPPPPPQVEVVGVAPSERHVWIGGFHRWDGHAYVWVPGHWDVRPHAHAAWVKGRWVKHHKGWYWVDGHWH